MNPELNSYIYIYQYNISINPLNAVSTIRFKQAPTSGKGPPGCRINLQVNGFQIHLQASCLCSCDDNKDGSQTSLKHMMYISTLRRILKQTIQEGTILEESNGFWPPDLKYLVDLISTSQSKGSEKIFAPNFFVSVNSGWQRWGNGLRKKRAKLHESTHLIYNSSSWWFQSV